MAKPKESSYVRWTDAQIIEFASENITLPVLMAAKLFGIGSAKAYQMLSSDEFPVPVRRVGSHHVVDSVNLLAAVGNHPLIARTQSTTTEKNGSAA